MVAAVIRDLSRFAKGTMFEAVLSRSKSKPSTTEVPNGRVTVEPDCTGPNIAHTLFAAVTAAAEVEKPPSV